MKALIVYDSHFGYTEQIAHAMEADLQPTFAVEAVRASGVGERELHTLDLLIVGGPTEGHQMTPLVRAWLDTVQSTDLSGVPIAAFDTRVGWPKLLSGSAADAISKRLVTMGGRRLVEPESFFVPGKDNPPPSEVELEHVRRWVAGLVAKLPVAVG